MCAKQGRSTATGQCDSRPFSQDLLHFICANGYGPHLAVNRSQVAAAVNEALGKHMDWHVQYHERYGRQGVSDVRL